MLKKSITYKNFNDVETTETFYFHMSQAELLRLEVSTKGGLQKALEIMVAAEDGAAIMDFMETFIKGAVGKKSDDGARFDKSPEVLADFLASPAYDTLFMELVTNPDSAAECLNGIVPAEMAANVERLSKLDQVKARVAERHPQDKPVNEGEPEARISDPSEGGNVFELDNTHPKPEARPIGLTPSQAREMDGEQLRSGLAEGKYILVSGE